MASKNPSLQQLLEKLEPSRRMDNLGMTSYGPDLMLRSMEVVGVKLKPALVVFCIHRTISGTYV